MSDTNQQQKLWAISDLHIANVQNRDALRDLPSFPNDWLILAGDICESLEHLALAFSWCVKKFARVIWVPGNHELWLVESGRESKSSQSKYQDLIELARSFGVLTPEDPWEIFPATGHLIVPLNTLYDYSYRPDHVSREDVINWAAEQDCVCSDEILIKTHGSQGIEQWSAELCDQAEIRFQNELPEGVKTILINHFPLREDLVHIPRVPRFSPWCGTKRTNDWHIRYRAAVVVSGHLHVRRTDWRDETRFEEVSLGYPKQWDPAKGLQYYLRDVTP